MKIGIITFHASHNCGSQLQAFALQQTLLKLGYDNEIIDFSNQGSREMYKTIPNIHPLKRGIRGRLHYWFKSIMFYKLLKKQAQYYNTFINNNFILSAKKYHSDNDLRQEKFDYSHFIAGSDQVWNICCPDADTAYYLDFVENGKKIAYAVSTGATIIKEKAKDIALYKKLVNDFYAISVREKNSVAQFKELTGRNDIELLIDPTMLFTQNDWEHYFDLNSPIIHGDYIFYYAFHYDHEVNKAVMDIAKKYCMPVYIIEARAWGPLNARKDGLSLCNESGPIAFLNLVKYAKMVLTTSFHGTAFSVIFRKNFWFIDSIIHNPKDDRVKTLLEQVKLTDRIISSEQLYFTEEYKAPDYQQMTDIIQSLQDKSIAYLKKNLS